jgi:DNA helicase-2/ATP-dependent DNA helicase PcrA
VENLQELKNALVEFSASDPGGGLEAFLERVSLVAEIDLYDDEEGAVTLMTLHNAKGLEFPVVFIVGMEDGVFPHMRCMGSMESMEEERRLFYVGVTRAQDRLYLTGAAHRSLYGNLKMSPESRFVRDIPRQYMEVIVPEGQAESGGAGDRMSQDELEAMASSFRVGESVVHDMFGEGVVTALARSRSGPEITVNFPGIGEKLFLLKYAPLRKR